MLNVLVDVINQLQIADGIFSSELAKETAYYQYQLPTYAPQGNVHS